MDPAHPEHGPAWRGSTPEPAARLVAQVGAGMEQQWGAAALVPGESGLCGIREIICSGVCLYGCIGVAVRVKISL